MFMDFACPMWRKPLGSGGKRVRMMGPLLALWAWRTEGVFSAHSSLRPVRALEFTSFDILVNFLDCKLRVFCCYEPN